VSLLVLLHGFTGAPGSWAPVLQRLPAGRRTLTPTLLGHAQPPAGGAATLLPATSSWHDEVERLAADIRRASPEPPVHLAGYSLGGRVALGIAARHPALVDRLTLIGASPGIADPGEREARRRADEARARLLETRGLGAFLDAWEAEPIFESQRALPAQVRARHRALRAAHDAEGLAASLRVLGQAAMPDLWPTLPALPMPVELVVGEADARLRQIAARMLALLPTNGRTEPRLIVVPGSGHDVGLERPDALAEILARRP
jgi:2-succinyl-6-hydroxy-2,4-cyclohexadiene-1-carboxylate synthase